jgi:hypothetical protein
MAEQIPIDANTKLLKQLAPLSSLPRPKMASTRHFAEGHQPEEIADWIEQLKVVEMALAEVEDRQRSYEDTVQRWEESPPMVMRAVKKGRGGEDKVCGMERDGVVCKTARRRCDRHQG